MQNMVKQTVHTATKKINESNGFIKASVYILLAFATVLIGYGIGLLLGMIFV